MTRNISLPSERQRGLKFIEKFFSIEEIYKNGGTITGTKAEYPEVSNIKTVIAKLKAVDTGSNTVKLNSSTTITITAGNVFGSYSNATAFDLDDFEVDDYSKFEYVRCFSEELTTEEISDYENDTTFTYIKDADVNLPMNLDNHDPDNTRTLDVSGNANHSEISGATKEAYKGYSFDGTDDYMALPLSAFSGKTEGTIHVEFNLDDNSDSTTRCLFAASDITEGSYDISLIKDGANFLYQIRNGSGTVVNITVASYLDLNYPNKVVVDIVCDSDGNHVYLNGELKDTDSSTDFFNSIDLTNVRLGNRIDSSGNEYYWKGNIFDFKFIPESLTPMQIKDLYVNSLGRKI